MNKMQDTLKDIESLIASLPNMEEKDVKDAMSNLNWIASGGRERYYQREALEKELVEWSRSFIDALNKVDERIKSYRSDYSSFEVSVPLRDHTLYAPYVLEHDIKSKEDFRITIVNYDYSKMVDDNLESHEFETPEEVIEFIEKNKEYHYK